MLSNAKTACSHADLHPHVEDRPVDLVHLAHHAMGDRDLECEILGLFQKQSVIYLARLREASDMQAWREAAHTLKGSARGIGAWAVAEAAADVESLSGKVAARVSSPEVEALASAIDDANAFIREVLADA